ncbi:MAG: ABC transporter permease [Burkholderiales bacterium]
MLPFQPVLLVTDALVFLLLAMSALLAWYLRRHEHLRAPWRRVARSRRGMGAAVVLTVFVVIGLLDSLHYNPLLPAQDGKRAFSTETRSALDALLGRLRAEREKTYSAPLATHLYSKETVELPDGTQVREYPRLRFGGAHLKDPAADWAGDVAKRTLAGLLGGGLVWCILVLAICAVLARRREDGLKDAWQRVWAGETDAPWDVMLAVAGALCVLAGVVAALATGYHVLGTDKTGQDVLYLSLKSIRTGLVIGTLATLIMLPLAVFAGIAAGYFRGWVDDLVQYVYTTLSSIPGVLLIAACVVMMQVFIDTHSDWAMFDTVVKRADWRLAILCAILGITSWTGLARLLRGETLKLREVEFVQAAHAFGVSDWTIITRHLLPNVLHIVLIALVMDFSSLVLAEAVLSYVGVGVDPSMNSFGTMINSARLEMGREPVVWWALASAFCFMLVLVLAANLFADAVRDALDPRIRPRRLTPARVAAYLATLARRRGRGQAA